ncbi:peptidoglycan recognition protein [Plakobranchus ocellatus]|uniref:Peptidoglycan recognition protein n=1 Tax=Plakobranchus ocellatus TaxID=259542 RepID=A0AAV4DJC2_9GAST|nr:peptidoglycan recognition protein [Plakobranchus ocellatus]
MTLHFSNHDGFIIAPVKFHHLTGWDDIGYSFLIGGEGTVFEGRGWDRVGAHTKGYNSVGLGFCLIGNFMDKSPTQIQLNTAKQLLECGVSQGKLRSDYIVRGHRDMVSTTCPGDTLYNIIRSWPQY